MKKLSILVLGTLLLVPSGAHAQSVGAGVADVVAANANWVIKRSPHSAVYRFVEADRWVNPIGATNTFADVGTVRCSIGEDGRAIVTSCKVVARILFIRPRDFEFDPLLRSAQLVLREKGMTHTASWTVKQDSSPAPTYFLRGDGRSVELTVSGRSRAQARGRVLGRHFSTKTDGGVATLSHGMYGVVIFDRSEGSYRRVYAHRSDNRRQARNWIAALVESL